MGLVRDWIEDTEGYRFGYRVRSFFSPSLWLRLHKWRKQRANRGWSDRDTWGAGDHIAQMTAEMLQYLQDHSYCDWPEWFKLNVREEGKGAYKNLQEVIDDINAYLEFQKTSWSDGLDTKRDRVDEVFEKREDGNYQYVGPDWYEGEKKLTQDAVRHRINKWRKEELKLYKKAQKAMGFFSRHFSGFWD
jgi:hypothetical protein